MVLVNYNSLGEQLWDCTWGGSNFDVQDWELLWVHQEMYML